ncbi:hypothetical protein ACT17_01560 [Mycolicibacterium conceptionense]|jgi:hypothetical protein|uniref:Transmembrane protein n=3 Tax=Mycolicibacterium TaxID=1866885 RepID=A0ABR5FNM4_9MYCO|nr:MULTISPECIES: DUF2561 family protein [Mycolicibacterium]KLI08740.1 hypothetical protein AA982_07265 [Mycolicibacterium senegalense]KLO48431.1 hypothetical protein ABW05_27575 [Mycolicibacterium senegalense]KMV20395.1 hypothetical protein ACT17_01560 [Mycolicibacterium conceptionense]OBJ93806.1 hypothetical protein A5639_06335 [Mycolicibacterium conceptionense]OMB79823.1 hypothetical protein A5746_06630 [Mycolicibacterium conceptionense]
MSGPISELDTTDRVLLGACAAVWLAALGAGVAAVVALVDLGRSHPQGAESADTPWVLYTVIGLSVVVIAGAVPLLLRARAQAGRQQPGRRPQPPARSPRPIGGSYRAAPPAMSRYAAGTGVAAAAVEAVWLRFTLSVACAIGLGTAAIGLATYLMATGSGVAAWCLYGLAGVVTAGLVAVLVVALRQLDTLPP